MDGMGFRSLERYFRLAPRYPSIRMVFVVSVCVLILSLGLILGWIFSEKSIQIIEKRTESALGGYANRTAKSLYFVLKRRLYGLQKFAEESRLGDELNVGRVERHLKVLQAYTPEFLTVALYDIHGRLIAGIGENELNQVSTNSWFEAGLRSPHTTTLLNSTRMVIPVFDVDGVTKGVLTATLSGKLLSLISGEVAHGGIPGVTISWLDTDINFVDGSSKSLSKKSYLELKKQVGLNKRGSLGIEILSGSFEKNESASKEYLAVWERVEMPEFMAGARELVVLARLPREEWIEPIRELKLHFFKLGGLFLMGSLILGGGLAALLVRPVTALSEDVMKTDGPLNKIGFYGYRETRRLGLILQRFIRSQRRINDDLQSQKIQLATLSRQLIETQAKERRELARKLHDEIGTELSSAKLILESFLVSQGSVLNNDSHHHGSIRNVVERLRDVLLHVRSALGELRPPLLIDFGLSEALAWEVERRKTESLSDIDIVYKPPLIKCGLGEGVEYALFMLVKEALNNSMKHAKASRIDVVFSIEQDDFGNTSFLVSVEDDGIGFDKKSIHPDRLGLIGMNERAAAVGLFIEIDTCLGRGTFVNIFKIPGS